MHESHRRHDISDKTLVLLEPHLPGREGTWGGYAKDNRKFINAVFWILRTGAPRRDLPPDYGDWKNTHRRFCRWRDEGVWKKLLERLVADPDYEWPMIDASHIKVHPHAAGTRGGNQDMGRTKGGLNTKLHMAVDAHGMPVRGRGPRADCKEASRLIEGIDAGYLLGDKGYDSNSIIEQAEALRMEGVIPPKKN